MNIFNINSQPCTLSAHDNNNDGNLLSGNFVVATILQFSTWSLVSMVTIGAGRTSAALSTKTCCTLVRSECVKEREETCLWAAEREVMCAEGTPSTCREGVGPLMDMGTQQWSTSHSSEAPRAAVEHLTQQWSPSHSSRAPHTAVEHLTQQWSTLTQQ